MYFELLTILQITLGINIGLKKKGYIRDLFLGGSEKNIEKIIKDTEALHENSNYKTNVFDEKLELEFLTIKAEINDFKKRETDLQEKFILNLVEKNKIAINNTIYFIVTIIIWGSLENSILKIIDYYDIKTIINVLWLTYTIFILILNVYNFILKKEYSFLSNYIPKKEYSFLLKRIIVIILLIGISISIYFCYFYTYNFCNNIWNIFHYKLILILNSFLPYIFILVIINKYRRIAKNNIKKIETKISSFYIKSKDVILEKFLNQ